MSCVTHPVFVPDIAAGIPGVWDSVTTDPFTAGGPPAGVPIEVIGDKLYAMTTAENPGRFSYVTKDVFGASGVDKMYCKFTVQEVTGNRMGANLYRICRVSDVTNTYVVDIWWEQDRSTLIGHFSGSPWFAGTEFIFDTSPHTILFCLDRTAGSPRKSRLWAPYIGDPDAEFKDPSTTAFGGAFRYVSFGAIDDHGATFAEHYRHELYISDIEVGTDNCVCYDLTGGGSYIDVDYGAPEGV